MSTENYWIGKGLDLDALWADYDGGRGYEGKVENSSLHLLRLTFDSYPNHLPLFDFEVIYKSVKGTFHDTKQEYLTPDQYNAACPIFLYRVDRGSGIFEFLAELDPLLSWCALLGTTVYSYSKLQSDGDRRRHERYEFVERHFPDVSSEYKDAYINAWLPGKANKAFERLRKQKLMQVQLSKNPFRLGEQSTMVDLTAELSLDDAEPRN